ILRKTAVNSILIVILLVSHTRYGLAASVPWQAAEKVQECLTTQYFDVNKLTAKRDCYVTGSLQRTRFPSLLDGGKGGEAQRRSQPRRCSHPYVFRTRRQQNPRGQCVLVHVFNQRDPIRRHCMALRELPSIANAPQFIKVDAAAKNELAVL